MSVFSRRRFLNTAGALAATGAVLDTLLAARDAQAAPEKEAADKLWAVRGSYFEACSCNVACPCVFTSAPSYGYCQALLAWHVDVGHFRDVALDGFNAVMALYSPEHLLKGNWKVALYVDQRATAAQREALGGIFSGQAGGHLAGLAPLIGEVLGVTATAIEFQSDDKRRKLLMRGLADFDVMALQGQGGYDVVIQSPPVTVTPGYFVVVAKSGHVAYRDHGLDWEFSDRNGFYSRFDYASA